MPDGGSARVFISYRRDDASAHAGRLHDHLAARLGVENVFIDIDGIAPGVDFHERIDSVLAGCSAELVVIGPRWLSTKDRDGGRRLDDPADTVRHEVAVALERGLLVVPVLVGGAQMPTVDDLPAEIASLAARNAVRLDDERWAGDVERLVAALHVPVTGRARPPMLVVGALAGLVVVLVGVAIWLPGTSSTPGPTSLAPTIPSLTSSSPSGPDASVGEPTGVLAFVRGDVDERSSLVTVDVTTGETSHLTQPGEPWGWPAWSPDGSQVAFAGTGGFSAGTQDFGGFGDYVVRFYPQGAALWIAEGGGEDPQQLLPARWRITDPAWSREFDLAFVSDPGKEIGGDIYVLESTAFGQHPHKVFDGDSSTGHVTWSRESDRLAFTHQGQIFVLELAGERASAVTSGGGSALEVQPAWSPDGHWIAYTSVRRDRLDIYIMDPDDPFRFFPITTTDAREEAPTWSPDGRWIAFVSNRGFQEDVWIMRPDGSDARRVTNDRDFESVPTWRA
jgi:hypothetical protein